MAEPLKHVKHEEFDRYGKRVDAAKTVPPLLTWGIAILLLAGLIYFLMTYDMPPVGGGLPIGD